jgi:steroid 5-alpha reductase family enzyme
MLRGQNTTFDNISGRAYFKRSLLDHLLGRKDLENISLTFSISAAALFFYMTAWAGYALAKKRNDLADQAWGLGFIIVAWIGYFLNPGSPNGILINVLISIWGVRLFIHIYLRHRLKEEDFRYKNMKAQWKNQGFAQVYFKVFLLQGVILYIIASPILWIHTHPGLTH